MGKFNKPFVLILIGSFALFFIQILILLLIHYYIESISYWIIFFLPFSISLFSYFIFYFLFEEFINEKLKVLYRTIKNEKSVNKSISKFNLIDDNLEDVQKEADIWMLEQNIEISKLKEQEEFRREFLGNLAHELKTPLFSIQGYIFTLLDGGLDDKNVNTLFLERATHSCDRLVNLLEDLDSITKMEVYGVQLEKVNYNIKKSVEEIFESLEIKAKEKNITLKFSKEYPAIMVNADKIKIEQVLSNLIANSIYYGNENGSTSVRFFEMNELILVEISDDGPGIEKEHIPRLFERFFRVEKSRTRNEGGSGLGLAISKHIIEAHNQKINVRSTVGLGSTFAFTLNKAKTSEDKLTTSRGFTIR
ncbi:MAG: sensor histidine kinase [Flavobacteriia bacterium]|nr:sensor histidine kinase [Flavobacteriia bacterium]